MAISVHTSAGYGCGGASQHEDNIFHGILNWKGLLLTFMTLFAERQVEKRNGKMKLSSSMCPTRRDRTKVSPPPYRFYGLAAALTEHSEQNGGNGSVGL